MQTFRMQVVAFKPPVRDWMEYLHLKGHTLPAIMTLQKSGLIQPEDLEAILDGAPENVEFKPKEYGFYLDNGTISLRYLREPIYGFLPIIYLWFIGTEPKIAICTTKVNWNDFPNNLLADAIFAHNGDTEDASLGHTQGIIKGGPYGDQNYFNIATRVLQKAAIKYHLKEWYERNKGIVGQLDEGIAGQLENPQTRIG